MKRFVQKLLLALAVVITTLGALFSTAYPLSLPTAHGAVVYESEEVRDNARQVAVLVNRERQAEGLPLLRYSDVLSEAANKRAKEIQTYFSHTRPKGTSCFTAVTEIGIRYRYIGENIAYGQRTPEEVMNGWMNSSGHRANILSPNVEYMGIGVTKKNGVYYWTQFFAASDVLESAAPVVTAPAQTPRTTAAATAAASATRTTAVTARTTASASAAATASSVTTTTAAAASGGRLADLQAQILQNACGKMHVSEWIALLKQTAQYVQIALPRPQ